MATTRSRTTKTSRKTTAPKTAARRTTTAKQNDGLAARTGRQIKERPYVSAAIASGAAAVVAGIAAGAYFLRKSDRTVGEIAGDTVARVKDGLSDASDFTSRKFDEARRSAQGLADRVRGEAEAAQEDFAEEAMSLKEVHGDTMMQSRTGSIAY